MLLLQKRNTGTLLHLSALPSRFGIGDLGPCAYRFADLLAESGHRYWQMLPLNPTNVECGNSPYTSESGFAGNLLFISPEMMADEGLIEAELAQHHSPDSSIIDYPAVERKKSALLRRAYQSFTKNKKDFEDDYGRFEEANLGWLDEYTLYKSICDSYGSPWYRWPEHLRKRDKESLMGFLGSESTLYHKFCQFIFFRQWEELRHYCKNRGIGIIGDLPYYVSHDSADVWSRQASYKLGDDYFPKAVSGVPPDYFSATGQLWGHPVYDWCKVEEDHFTPWMERIGHNLRLFDMLRIDHFRGLLSYWEVPAGETTAVKGAWVSVPSEAFFEELVRNFPGLPFIAEDLGVITDDVRQTMRRLGLPGMRVLIFGFDGDPNNPHLPNNMGEDTVSYTGTHDTNTARGWFLEEAGDAVRKSLFTLIGSSVSETEVSWALMKLASASLARLCVFPVQDALSLGSESRLNRPSVAKGNYLWRLTESQLASFPVQRLRDLATATNRL